MKKALSILTLSFAFVAFTITVNAQSTITTKESKASATKVESASDIKTNNASEKQKNDIAVKQAGQNRESATTNKAPKKEVKSESTADLIKQYEQKIEQNRNNPKFDVKAAEAELEQLRKQSSGK